MILFVADDHYNARPGYHLAEKLKLTREVEFYENDWSALEQDDLFEKYELIVLNMIADTCGIPKPEEKAEQNIKKYLEAGGSMLLCHGASAAFWHWEWWRPLVGYRWVRGNDPDGVAASTHPKRPFEVMPAKCSHPLVKHLKKASFPTDEIYIYLEQTCPVTVLMETTTDEGTFPQAYLTTTPWGGTLLSTLPGHAAEVVVSEENLKNTNAMLDFLLDESKAKIA